MNRPTTAITRSSPKPRIYSARRSAVGVWLGSDGFICPRVDPRRTGSRDRSGVGGLAADEPAVHNSSLSAAVWLTRADPERVAAARKQGAPRRLGQRRAARPIIASI